MEILVASSAEDVSTCLALRREVFVVEQGVPQNRELDGLDDTATHYLLRLEGQPVGTARLRINGPVAKIERVAVIASARGNGYARALMQHMIREIAAHKDVTETRVSAQTYVAGLYRQLGFAELGKVYQDAGMPHIVMALDMKADRP